ncbi:hypothetical protein DFH07DRAFT_784405 [Mycena maculata]|uniref:Nephrocystin 3-like N-terminal domain-containing protein n=1 Tax=Mycena maculata TaxID=230809 RepID=A0AAD7MJI7_9AGAR|nr:hypothetical protein DFH07DRAFT_784405 [Mycena maculata]
MSPAFPASTSRTQSPKSGGVKKVLQSLFRPSSPKTTAADSTPTPSASVSDDSAVPPNPGSSEHSGPRLVIKPPHPLVGDSFQGPDSSTIKKNAKLAWHGFKLVAKDVEEFLDGTPFKIPVAVFNKIIESADAVIDNKESMAELLLPIGQRLGIISKELMSKRLPKDINPLLNRFASTLRSASEELERMHESGLFERILELDKHPNKIQDIFRRVDEATKNFELELNLATFRQANAVKESIDVTRLNSLRPIKEAKYPTLERKPPVKPCVPGTREEVIQDIMSWCKDTSTDSPAVYWLSGMAGTGKSTIAYTICEQLVNGGQASRLAASFFCWRQSEAARKQRNIIPTLAYNLALQLPGFCQALLESRVDADPPSLKNHLETLILKPWDAAVHDRSGLPPLVVVVDVLDEVEVDEDYPATFLEDLIKKIEGHQDHLRGLKFFVTSRRDPRIVTAGRALPPASVCRLEDVDKIIMDSDISTYLRASLPRLDLDQLHRLSDQADGLFIYAATAVRFIIPPLQNPPPTLNIQKDRLQTLLKMWPDKSRRGTEGLLVDRLYEDLLSQYLSSMAEHDQKISLSIVHTAICAEEPIVVSDIPPLLRRPDMDEEDVIAALLPLHAVLYVSSSPARVFSYHKSFTDFMVDPTRFSDQTLAEICCPIPAIQVALTRSCFRLMESLRFNICDLGSSFLNDSEVEGLRKRTHEKIPSTLRYACRHWAVHLSKTPSDDQALRQNIVVDFQRWLEERLLFCQVEAMNLLEMIGECYYALVTARRWLGTYYQGGKGPSRRPHHRGDLVTVFGSSVMSQSTPHLYLSALSASSRDSTLMARWREKCPGIPIITAIVPRGRQLSLLQHEDSVHSVAFSPDGLHAISGSRDCAVRIWDISTGTQLHRLDGHERPVRSVTFSADGLRAISGSQDNTVRVWEVATGTQLHQLVGHEDWVMSVGFSPDGLRAISGSADRTVRIWDVSTETQLHRLDGHQDTVQAASFSPDGLHAISGSDDKTVRIWDATTGKQLYRLAHKASINSIGFSRDGLRAISGSDDKTVQIWDIVTETQLHWLDGHEKRVWSVGFSPDGLHAISGSEDKTVRIWTLSQLGNYFDSFGPFP